MTASLIAPVETDMAFGKGGIQIQLGPDDA